MSKNKEQNGKLNRRAFGNITSLAVQKDAESIKKLIKSGGKVTGYELSNGQVLSKAEGVALAKQGGIKGVAIASRNGNEYLRSYPDSGEGNNLGNLPSKPQEE